LDNYVIISADSAVSNALSQALEGTNVNESEWIENGLLVLAKVNGKNIIAGD
jgi:hypothetical protein